MTLQTKDLILTAASIIRDELERAEKEETAPRMDGNVLLSKGFSRDFIRAHGSEAGRLAREVEAK